MFSIEYSLPSQSTPFIGRQEELAEICALLADPACRLLTLTGPGGIGKTRLAVQAAGQMLDSFPDGLFFVPLQAASSADYLIPAIADAIRLSFHSSESPRNLLLQALRPKRALLILDNFEHLFEAVDLIPQMLAAAPQLKVLVTSREVLELQEEWVRPVAGLSYPEGDEPEEHEAYSAVELFKEAARRARPDFSLARERDCVVRICQLVQGMPLAIELAAAWLRALPCAEILSEIQNSLDFLATAMRNVPERHRSLRAVFEPSWNMLSSRQQEVFELLSIFQGGFERPAAQAVAGADLPALHALVDKSLLRVSPSGRYEIHEVLRQFAREKLAGRPAGDRTARQKHCEYCASFLEQKEAVLRRPGQAAALDAIERELDNLRVAWRYAIENSSEQPVRQSMGALLIYYHARAHFEEGAEAFHRAADRWENSPGFLLGELYLHEAWFEAVIGRGQAAAYLFEKGLELIPAETLNPTTRMTLVGINYTGWLSDAKTRTKDKISQIYRDLLARCEGSGDAWGMGWMQYGLGLLAHYEENDPQACEAWMHGSVDSFRRQGDLWASTFPLHHLGVLYEHLERYLEARTIYHETLAICRQVGDAGGVEFALGQLGQLAAHEQDFAQSWPYYIDAMQLAYSIQRDLSMTFHMFEMGDLLYRFGRRARAVEIFAFLVRFTPYEAARDYIQQRLDEIRLAMPADEFEAARRRGEAGEYRRLVEELSTELAAAELPSVLPDLPGGAATGRGLVEPLSPRELEVLALVAAGHSNREIARMLVVTEGTVKKHINNIFGKLQARSRTQAVARARELRLLA